MEHLTDHDKKKEKKSRTPLESFLGIAEQQEKIEGAAANGVGFNYKKIIVHNVFDVEQFKTIVYD